MNFKIEPVVDSEGGSVFRVSGDLRGDSVRILEELLTKVTKHVVLDLTEVILADRHAVALLALCEQNGGQLMNCPAYLREWVTNERANIRSGRK
jgi:anti-anti-sigma regulatory factor